MESGRAQGAFAVFTEDAMKLPAHFWIDSCDGNLFDTRKPEWYKTPIRYRYQYTFARMNKLSQVTATLRAGPVAWPGGYPLYLVTEDGAALCFDCARNEFRQIAWDYLHSASTGWNVIGCEVNYEDDSLYCDHCSKQIESAYGEKETT